MNGYWGCKLSGCFYNRFNKDYYRSPMLKYLISHFHSN